MTGSTYEGAKMTAELLFQFLIALWAGLCGLSRDRLGRPTMSRRQCRRCRDKWLVLACAVWLVAALASDRITLICIATLPFVSGTVNRWFWPWLDRMEMRRDG